ncbi:hypothetical protein BDV98DRAFT_506782 [Pterulicium gracile]|uniref:Peptidase C15, pyroglutamyl peptidase I-like protein n=1 Tax=Pterulicium gracile TaxID=1884261 RepID=A0A5C3QHJ6_9AGAR|nr:hypothetical protein BDV98DRAFT_506782 [Pterula gracilis]
MSIADDSLRVLLTGFGPCPFSTDQSWQAAKAFHNTTLTCPIPHEPIDLASSSPTSPLDRPIHITSLHMPVSYQAVLDTVPGIYAQPPRIPHPDPKDNLEFVPPPADRQYDFIFHLGVAGRGPLRVERQAHRSGYQMKDADGKHAALSTSKDFRRHMPPEGIKAIVDEFPVEPPGTENLGPPQRGFGDGYDGPEEMMTHIDATSLVQDLVKAVMQDASTSMDAGHHLGDYIYYCSLAESRRNTKPYEKRVTQVLLLHCPPEGSPLSLEQTCSGIKYTIMW